MKPCGKDCYATRKGERPDCQCVCKGNMYKQYQQDKETDCEKKIKSDKKGGCMNEDIRKQCCVTCNKVMKGQDLVPPTIRPKTANERLKLFRPEA